MSRENVYNFAAGPSVMPTQALEKAASEMLDYNGSGCSVMEMSHRSKAFGEIFEGAKEKLRNVLKVPDTHEILFLQGGATLQFAAIPMNLLRPGGTADYAVTGNFSGLAAEEAKKYGSVNIAASSADRNHSYIPCQASLNFTQNADYFYYCANNTIYGTEWQYVPETPGTPLVCDMSSDILTRPVDFSKYALVYAGAQKNMAPAGLTVVIVDKSLAGHALPLTPKVMDYGVLIQKDSMLNTPPCWCIYMLGLTLDWVIEQGGIPAMEELKRRRAGMLYDFLDNSRVFIPHAEKGSRSYMNVTFRTDSAETDAQFVSGAAERGLLNLRGHRMTGGMRASIYNAMPVEGVKKLVEYMKEFEVLHL
jgi:phosphoserine aminotransferase